MRINNIKVESFWIAFFANDPINPISKRNRLDLTVGFALSATTFVYPHRCCVIKYYYLRMCLFKTPFKVYIIRTDGEGARVKYRQYASIRARVCRWSKTIIITRTRAEWLFFFHEFISHGFKKKSWNAKQRTVRFRIETAVFGARV